MDLPQELIEEILSHLYPNDRESLLSFSNYPLVSKSWLDPSRRTLFAKISIGPSTYDRFLNTISSTNTKLLRHVRSLSYVALENEYRRPHCPIYRLEDYFPSLSQLQELDFIQMQIDPAIPRRLDLLSAFQHTLSLLHLAHSSITWSGFASLVGYFPGLRNLFIDNMSFEMDDRPVPDPSRALRGKLSLTCLSGNHDTDTLVNRFSGLKPEYEEVALGLTVEDQRRFLPIFQESLKVLDILWLPRCTSKTLDLSLCPELQEIHIRTVDPYQQDVSPISSITPINLRRIVLTFLPNHSPPEMTWNFILGVGWSHLDDMVCELADRLCLLGGRHVLEVVFRLGLEGFETVVDEPELLPRFREKGRVRMLEARESMPIG